jgi:ribosome maturation factor RimP
VSDNLTEVIHSIAEDRFKEEDLSHCFIVEIVKTGKKLEVFMDGDEGISFKDCQRFSRAIEAYLDESKTLGDNYTLNVSSPGVDRPLRYYRQYPKHIGRKLEVKMTDDEVIVGKLKALSEESITIETPKTKKIEAKEHTIKFENIKNSKVLISF